MLALDLAIVFPNEYGSELAIRELLQDRVYLCVSDKLLQQHYSPNEIAAIKARYKRHQHTRF